MSCQNAVLRRKFLFRFDSSLARWRRITFTGELSSDIAAILLGVEFLFMFDLSQHSHVLKLQGALGIFGNRSRLHFDGVEKLKSLSMLFDEALFLARIN